MPTDYDQGTAALGARLNQGMADYNKLFANSRIADSMVKTNPEMLTAGGIDPDQFRTYSAQDKVSAVAGIMQAQGAQAERQRMQAQIADYASQAQERTNIGQWRTAQAASMTGNVKDDQTAGQFAQDYLKTYTQSNSDDPENDALSYAVGKNPGMSASALLKGQQLIASYRSMTGDSTPPTVLKDNPYPGVSIVQDPRTGTTHIVQDPSQAVQPLTDENGDQVPGGYVSRGGVRFAPTVKPTDQSLIDERTQTSLTNWHKRLDPVMTQYDYATAKAGDPATSPADKAKYTALANSAAKQRDQILSERPKIGDAAAPAASAKAPATPKTKADFDALPSGAQFINPADGKTLTKK